MLNMIKKDPALKYIILIGGIAVFVAFANWLVPLGWYPPKQTSTATVTNTVTATQKTASSQMIKPEMFESGLVQLFPREGKDTLGILYNVEVRESIINDCEAMNLEMVLHAALPFDGPDFNILQQPSGGILWWQDGRENDDHYESNSLLTFMSKSADGKWILTSISPCESGFNVKTSHPVYLADNTGLVYGDLIVCGGRIYSIYDKIQPVRCEDMMSR